jgi:hypothetical protein
VNPLNPSANVGRFREKKKKNVGTRTTSICGCFPSGNKLKLVKEKHRLNFPDTKVKLFHAVSNGFKVKNLWYFSYFKGFVSKKLCRSQRQEESKKHHHSYGPHIFFALLEKASTVNKNKNHTALSSAIIPTFNVYILTFSVITEFILYP